MPRNPNLIPTAIVDVTGKRTTVHRKPDGSKKLTGRGIPSPASPEPEIVLDDQTIRTSIAYVLGRIDYQHPDSRTEQRIVASLNGMSRERLKQVHAATYMVKEIERQVAEREGSFVATGSGYCLLNAIENNDQSRIDIIIEHGAKLSGHLAMRDLVGVVEKLRAMDNTRVNFTQNMDAHLYAAGRTLSITGTGTPDFYYSNEKLIRFINKHPDKVDECLQFRAERELKEFKESDFEQWLQLGAMRDGML